MKRSQPQLSVFGLTLVVLLLLSAPAFAQISLREALDFDGDNKADYSIFRPSNSVWYVQGSAGGFQYKAFSLSTRDYLTPGDYDGDNKADYSVWQDSTGTWFRYNSSNNTTTNIQFGVSGDEPVARDYDGDGKTDLAFARRTRSSCNANGNMYWYILRSSDNVTVAYQFGFATDYIAPGDYDGDGKFDLAVQRPVTYAPTPPFPTNNPICLEIQSGGQSNFYIYRSSDNVLQSMTFNLSNDLVVPGDYDGDGKTDIAVVREGNNSSANLIWYIQQSTAGYKAVSFGLTGTDKTAQADYDGDGKTDIAIWRETDQKFYVSRSSDNGLGVLQFGSYGDFPVAGYDTH